MAAAVSHPSDEFGFVPHATVASLRDLGNWKVRADAIQSLHKLVLDLPRGAPRVLPSLGEFAGFLNTLLADPNFKISLTTLQIWDALLAKVGADLSPAIAAVVPTLVRRLGDGKSVVREANMSSLAASFRASPKETVDALFAAFRDAGSTAASARVREDALCAVVRCLLEPNAFPSPGVDPAALVSELVAAASEDPKESEHPGAARVRATAVEALAVAHAAYGASQSWRLIDCASEFAGGRECAPGLRRALERRFDDGSLPAVTREGLIEHAEGADEVLRRPRPEEASHRTLETLPASLSRASSRATSRGSFSRGGGGGSGSRGGSGAGAGASGSGSSGASSFHARLLKQMGRSPREVAAPGGGFPSDGSSSRASSTPSPDSSAASESESGRRAFEEPESVRDPSRLRTTSAGSGVSAASGARRSTSLGRRAAAANERRLAVKTTSERRGLADDADARNSAEKGGADRKDAEAKDGSDPEDGTGARPRGSVSPRVAGKRPAGGGVRRAGPSLQKEKAVADEKDPSRGSTPSGPSAPPSRSGSSDAGAKLSALKRRQELSRQSSQKSYLNGSSRGSSASDGVGPGFSEKTVPTDAASASAFSSRARSFAAGGIRTPAGFGGGRRERGNEERAPEASRAIRASAEGVGAIRASAEGVLARPAGGSGSGSGSIRRSGSGSGSGSAPGSLRSSLSDKNAAPLPEVSTEDLAPYAGGPDQPASALREALDALTTASTAKPKELDWEAQYDGLLAARRLTKHHGTLVAPGLHQLVLALVPAVDALRSSVAKQATALAREMALFLPADALDAELEYLLPALAKKSGEPTWLGAEADAAMAALAGATHPGRVVGALLPLTRHKSPATRRNVAAHLEAALCAGGKAAFEPLSVAANKDLLEKTFAALSPLLEEGDQTTRGMTKRAVCHLRAVLTSGDWEKLLKKLPSENRRKAVRAVASAGPPPLPARSLGASASRQPSPATGSSRGGERDRASGDHGDHKNDAAGHEPGEGPANPRAPSDERQAAQMMEVLSPILAKLRKADPSDWSERLSALDRLESVATASPRGAWSESASVAVFDALTARIADGNQKVAAKALEATALIVRRVEDDAHPALATLIPALAAALGASSATIRERAADAGDATVESVTATRLVAHVAQSCAGANQRAKPALLRYLRVLTEATFRTRPQLASKHALPVAMATLAEERGAEARAANAELLEQLATCVGREALMSHAAMKSATHKSRLEEALRARGA